MVTVLKAMKRRQFVCELQADIVPVPNRRLVRNTIQDIFQNFRFWIRLGRRASRFEAGDEPSTSTQCHLSIHKSLKNVENCIRR